MAECWKWLILHSSQIGVLVVFIKLRALARSKRRFLCSGISAKYMRSFLCACASISCREILYWDSLLLFHRRQLEKSFRTNFKLFNKAHGLALSMPLQQICATYLLLKYLTLLVERPIKLLLRLY